MAKKPIIEEDFLDDIDDIKDKYIIKRSVTLFGRHQTSISLEDEFWSEIKKIAAEKNLSLNKLVSQIDQTRQGSLSSAIRLYVLNYYRGKVGGAL